MAVIPTNRTVTLRRRATDTLDEYGNAIGDYEDIETYDVWFERTRYNEPQLDGETDAADFLLLIPGGVELVDGDRFDVEGDAYDVVADPGIQRPPGGSAHHTECRLRPAVVPTLRDKAIAQMRDGCIITREATDAVFDSGTGLITPGTATTIYEGPCWVRSRDAYNREARRIDEPVTLQSYTAVIPWDVTDIDDDDVLTVTRTNDPRLLNRSMRISGINVTSDAAARVVFLEDNLDA